MTENVGLAIVLECVRDVIAKRDMRIKQLEQELAWAQHEVARLQELVNAVPAVPVAAGPEEG